MKNKKYIKIIKISPINYNLKSYLEKKSILNSYKTFLKTCSFNIQILIQSSKENLEKNNFNIVKNIQKKENSHLKNISKKYIEYINNLNLSKKSSSKNFYIVISSNKNINKENIENIEIIKSELKEKFFKIKESISRCGNTVYEINNKEEVFEIIYEFLNTRKKVLKLNNKEEYYRKK